MLDQPNVLIEITEEHNKIINEKINAALKAAGIDGTIERIEEVLAEEGFSIVSNDYIDSEEPE